MTDILLTLEEAAQHLQISTKTLTRWRDARKIPYIQLPNGRTRFGRRELDEWVRSRTRRPRGA